MFVLLVNWHVSGMAITPHWNLIIATVNSIIWQVSNCHLDLLWLNYTCKLLKLNHLPTVPINFHTIPLCSILWYKVRPVESGRNWNILTTFQFESGEATCEIEWKYFILWIFCLKCDLIQILWRKYSEYTRSIRQFIAFL